MEGIWNEVRGSEELKREREGWDKRIKAIELGLRKCPVCGERVGVKIFGLEGNGVWIGCNKGVECSRYIELHTEGWSVEEVAAEWNRNNSGIRGMIRRAKMGIKRQRERIKEYFRGKNRGKRREEGKK